MWLAARSHRCGTGETWNQVPGMGGTRRKKQCRVSLLFRFVPCNPRHTKRLSSPLVRFTCGCRAALALQSPGPPSLPEAAPRHSFRD